MNVDFYADLHLKGLAVVELLASIVCYRTDRMPKKGLIGFAGHLDGLFFIQLLE